MPETGVLDTDMLYRIQIAPDRRVMRAGQEDQSLGGTAQVLRRASRTRYLETRKAVRDPRDRRRGEPRPRQVHQLPRRKLLDGRRTPTRCLTIASPDGHSDQGYIGGRDDAFFNDLPGFFRSINYAPQFYHVPHTMTEARELPIPKTFLELEGNDLFNFDPANPEWGHGVKKDLPPGPLTWKRRQVR